MAPRQTGCTGHCVECCVSGSQEILVLKRYMKLCLVLPGLQLVCFFLYHS